MKFEYANYSGTVSDTKDTVTIKIFDSEESKTYGATYNRSTWYGGSKYKFDALFPILSHAFDIFSRKGLQYDWLHEIVVQPGSLLLRIDSSNLVLAIPIILTKEQKLANVEAEIVKHKKILEDLEQEKQQLCAC